VFVVDPAQRDQGAEAIRGYLVTDQIKVNYLGFKKWVYKQVRKQQRGNARLLRLVPAARPKHTHRRSARHALRSAACLFRRTTVLPFMRDPRADPVRIEMCCLQDGMRALLEEEGVAFKPDAREFNRVVAGAALRANTRSLLLFRTPGPTCGDACLVPPTRS